MLKSYFCTRQSEIAGYIRVLGFRVPRYWYSLIRIYPRIRFSGPEVVIYPVKNCIRQWFFSLFYYVFLKKEPARAARGKF